MTPFSNDRRLLLSALIVSPFGEIVRVVPAVAQTADPLPPIVYPPRRPRPDSLRGHALFAIRPSRRGIKPMARWSSATEASSARAETTSSYKAIRPRTRFAMPRAGSTSETSRIVTCTRPRRPARCVRARSIGHASAAITPRARRKPVSPPSLPAEQPRHMAAERHAAALVFPTSRGPLMSKAP
jgi:hypothetical protein